MSPRSLWVLRRILDEYRRKAVLALLSGNVDRAQRLADRWNAVAAVMAAGR